MGDPLPVSVDGLGKILGRMSAVLDCTIDHETKRELDWERVGKLPEEAGEAFGALIGWHGSNPRKGRTHELADVLGELLDVAVSALGAWEHLSGNPGSVGAALVEHASRAAARLEPLVPAFAVGDMVKFAAGDGSVFTVTSVDVDRWGVPVLVHAVCDEVVVSAAPRTLLPWSMLDALGDARCVFWVCADRSHRGVTWVHDDAGGSVASCDVCGARSA